MKSRRHDMILKIIKENRIETQEELQEKLLNEGIEVTQATISRDIKNLKLIKKRAENGQHYYVTYDSISLAPNSDRMSAIFKESVLSIDYVDNIVLVKCHSGMANAACAAFDRLDVSDVVGTLSGDDTFLILMKSSVSAKALVDELLANIK